jgi:DNA-binding IclR family transcriptional regulator
VSGREKYENETRFILRDGRMRRAKTNRQAERPSPAPKARKPYSIAALRASLNVLDQFGQRETWGLSDLTQEVGQSKTRVFRILNTFEECGYLVREQGSGSYRLGPRLSALSTGSVKFEQLRWRAIPPLQTLAESTGETVHVGILYGGQVVTVQLVEGRHEIRMHSTVGKRSPAHASSLGKVLLAYYPEPEIDEFLRTAQLTALTPNTVVDPIAFKRHLLEIRSTGYALDNEELELGLRCVAAPITDHTGLVVASVSVSAPAIRLGPEAALNLVPKVKETGRAISRMLGSPSLAGAKS